MRKAEGVSSRQKAAARPPIESSQEGAAQAKKWLENAQRRRMTSYALRLAGQDAVVSLPADEWGLLIKKVGSRGKKEKCARG